MEDKLKLIKLTFSYELMENVDNALKKEHVLRKSYGPYIDYTLAIKEENLGYIINILQAVTFNQIKIEIINNNDDEEQEVGTDKPIGSKSAIDEN